jgi:transmembrane sensor
MNVTTLPQAQPAAEWFARVRGGEVDASADAAWQAFVREPQNEAALERCEAAWALSAELAGSASIESLLADVERRLAAPPRASTPRWRSWRAAAAALIAALGITALLLLNRGSSTVAQYDTARAEERVVNLEDGSVVTLNTGTAVRITYSKEHRRIDLLRGEALFRVAKDASRPFEVHALEGVTTAVGTRFDVEVNAGSAAVTVLEGTVTVSGSSGAGAAVVPVSAGQAVDYTASGAVSEPRAADVGRIQGWEVHRIVFSDVTLAQALADYNRYSEVPIVLDAPGLESRHINGVFRIGDEQAFLGALEQGLHLKAERGDGQK